MTGGGARLALVTGGTRGIGRTIALRLASEGYRVVAAGRRAPDAAFGPGIEFASCDVADPAAVRRLFEGLRERQGGLEVLVNNAGLAGANPLDPEGDDALWHAILATNLNGTYHCCKAALPLLPEGRGRIINIASVLGLRGVPDQTAYCAAKHGVVGLTRALAMLLAPRGITVNALCPGWVDTEMAAQRLQEIGLTRAEAESGVPSGRFVQAEEVAAAVAWLVRPEAASLTGLALPVDGGRLAAA